MPLHLHRLVHHVRHGLAAAVGWTVLQQAAFFASAALIAASFGADAFGAYGQALALAAMLAACITFRLELAAQLTDDDTRSRRLSGLAAACAGVLGGLATLLSAIAWAIADWPGWLAGGAAASAPLAWVLIAASHRVRRGSVVTAAAWRALPAVATLLLQGVAAIAAIEPLVIASLPLGAFAAAAAIGLYSGRRPAGLIADRAHWPSLFASQTRFMRAELPAFVLNAVSLQGQVLLVGALAGSADAGRFAIAQRIAFAPTSLLGPALTDWLRARILVRSSSEPLRRPLLAALVWMAVLSLVVHAALASVTPWIVTHAFGALGPVVTSVALVLLIVGAIRLVVSPWTFLLPLRGRFNENLGGQVALCAVALAATATGLRWGGLVDVAWLYVGGASAVYLLYLFWCARCASGALGRGGAAMARGAPHV